MHCKKAFQIATLRTDCVGMMFCVRNEARSPIVKHDASDKN
jgi:hypothetical protein